MQSLVDMRRQLDDLQRQLGTGQKADTYAGIGIDRGLAVGLRAHLSALGGFGDAITHVGVRIDLAQSALSRMSDITHAVKAAAFQSPSIDSSGATLAQATAYSHLGEMLGLLNTQVGDRYLFSGRGTDKPAVETLDHILDGDGARAGFKQIVSERKQADLGAGGLGRLAMSNPVATSLQVAEDAVSPFGFKLAAVTSTLTGATVTSIGTAGGLCGRSRRQQSDRRRHRQVQLHAARRIERELTLTATTSTTPGPNEFTIGADSTATAAICRPRSRRRSASSPTPRSPRRPRSRPPTTSSTSMRPRRRSASPARRSTARPPWSPAPPPTP